MRVAVLIISLVLMVVVFFGSCLMGCADTLHPRGTLSQQTTFGLIMTLALLLGGAFAMGVPLISTGVFMAAFFVSLVLKESTFAIITGILGVMSILGVLELRRNRGY